MAELEASAATARPALSSAPPAYRLACADAPHGDGEDAVMFGVHEWISHRGRLAPEAAALRHRDEVWTYADLEREADRVCARLQAERCAPGSLVVVCVPRSPRMIAAVLGVLKAGCAYLPVDTAMPGVRLDMILEDARPDMAVIEAAAAQLFDGRTVHTLVLDDGRDVDPAPTAGPAVAPTALAYVIYTSGSTGRPKGVEIEHGSVTALMRALLAGPGFSCTDVMLASAPISFDMSVADIFLPLVAGGCVVLLDREEVVEPSRLIARIEAAGVTVIEAVPALLRALLEAGWKGSPDLRIFCGGEALSRELADRLLPCCAELWNLYGPTEATVWATAARIEADNAPVTVGRPLSGYRVTIGDAQGASVREGDSGEILIAGVGLARGYRHNPALTAGRFVERDGDRFYRTGDVGSRGSDGAITCMGRLDDQVKIRGFRVELGDVEAALGALPGVAWAAARVWNDGAGDALVAYVVWRPGLELSRGDLRAQLSMSLPEYMVPTGLVVMGELPLNVNGKVDRQALPRPAAAPAVAETAAHGGLESRLGAIWCEVLGLERVEPTDNFFDLGGYSLLTVRLLSRIREAFGRQLSFAELFGAPTLAHLAAVLRVADEGAPAGFIPLQPLGDRRPLIWFDVGPQMRRLAVEVGKDQPILGLNLSPGEEADLRKGVCDVPRLAAAMVADLLRLRPHGPYRLGGWCRWGVVAYEAARQLRSAGAEVEIVVVLDAPYPAVVLNLAEVKRSVGAAVAAMGRGTAKTPFGDLVERAARNYRPRRLDGDVLLLQAAEDARGAAHAKRWRRRISGRFEVKLIRGDHVTLLKDPNVSLLAGALRSALS